METIQMNKLITSSTDEKTDEIDEILQDAENIILASNGDTKKHIRNKGLIIFAIVIAILAILLLAFSTVFALININSNKIMNGVFIQGIDENIYVFYTARNSFYIAFNVFTIEGEIEDFYYMSISQRKAHLYLKQHIWLILHKHKDCLLRCL